MNFANGWPTERGARNVTLLRWMRGSWDLAHTLLNRARIGRHLLQESVHILNIQFPNTGE